ncbi:MAG TPA: helix-turn-helix transcriptional regulator [Humibacter sp.]|nr:helix-turn-helix transcriptional regulator [Humibacter sp.]
MVDVAKSVEAADRTLGGFLRGRRATVTAEHAGFTVGALRRVPGLRREEVAVLAGVSADYYTRLEQGREQHPSPEVLQALSRALRLGPDEREHMFRLAEVALVSGNTPSLGVSAMLRGLLDQLADSPALVLGHDLDVLARNKLAEALHSDFTIRDNFARMCFVDEVGRRFYRDWSEIAGDVVGNLRFALGVWPDSAPLLGLVEELRTQSMDFDLLWNAQGVRVKRTMTKRFRHSWAGDLDVDYQSFDVRGADGQQLVVIGAPAGSPAAARLAGLRG